MNYFKIILIVISSGLFGLHQAIAQIEYEKKQIAIEGNFQVTVDYGKMKVPENRLSNSKKQITLHFVKLRSKSKSPGAPIIYLAGGPGVSGINTLKTESLIFFELLSRYSDVILLDQRGTGNSEPILTENGNFELPIDKPIDSKESMDKFYNMMQNWVSSLKDKGIDINAYNTLESAKDIDDLRQALGVKQIVVWGHSYGSHLAIAYIRYFEDHVSRAILTGVNGLDQRFRFPTEINSVFEELDRLVKAAPNMRKIDSFKELVVSELEKLNTPVATDVVIGNKTEKLVFGRKDVEAVVAINLTNISFIRELPQMFYSMANRDYEIVGRYIIKSLRRRPIGTPMTYSMHYASGCSDSKMKDITKNVNRGVLRDAINFPFNDERLKSIWSISDLGEAFRSGFRSNTEVLILSGNLDGRTTLENAKEVRANFPNSRQVIFNNASHDLPSEALPIFNEFFAGRIASDSLISCRGIDFYDLNSNELIKRFVNILMNSGLQDFKSAFIVENGRSSGVGLSKTLVIPIALQLIQKKRPDLALQAIEVSESVLGSENSLLQTVKGDVYMMMGNKERGKLDYQRALELNPLNFLAYKALRKLEYR